VKTIVLGIGNEYRGDDAAGRLVVRRMADWVPAGVEVRECSGESATLMELWQGFERVYLVDAVESRQPPGTLHRIAAHEEEMPRDFFHCSTHAFSLAEAIELARALDELPPEVIVYGIEGRWFESGKKLTPDVEAAIPVVADRIIEELKKG
jgi:hydrogenase maturation protease